MTPPLTTPRIRLRAADVMSAPVLTVRTDTSVKDIAAMMLAHHISGLPVVTADGDLVGIVTEADMLHKETTPGPRAGGLRRLAVGRAAAARKTDARTAADLMTRPVISVEESTPLRDIAALMVRRQINRVPVLREGNIVGIVTRADVVRAFTRTDADIAAAVTASLLHELWVDTSRIRVDVRDGVVYLDGAVESLAEKQLAERWVRTIDGVVQVESALTPGFVTDEAAGGGR